MRITLSVLLASLLATLHASTLANEPKKKPINSKDAIAIFISRCLKKAHQEAMGSLDGIKTVEALKKTRLLWREKEEQCADEGRKKFDNLKQKTGVISSPEEKMTSQVALPKSLSSTKQPISYKECVEHAVQAWTEKMVDDHSIPEIDMKGIEGDCQKKFWKKTAPTELKDVKKKKQSAQKPKPKNDMDVVKSIDELLEILGTDLPASTTTSSLSSTNPISVSSNVAIDQEANKAPTQPDSFGNRKLKRKYIHPTPPPSSDNAKVATTYQECLDQVGNLMLNDPLSSDRDAQNKKYNDMYEDCDKRFGAITASSSSSKKSVKSPENAVQSSKKKKEVQVENDDNAGKKVDGGNNDPLPNDITSNTGQVIAPHRKKDTDHGPSTSRKSSKSSKGSSSKRKSAAVSSIPSSSPPSSKTAVDPSSKTETKGAPKDRQQDNARPKKGQANEYPRSSAIQSNRKVVSR